jgi:hypothetical protein
MNVFEVATSGTRRFSIEGLPSRDFNVIVELWDKNAGPRHKISVSEMLKRYRIAVGKEAYLFPTTFQTTPDRSDVVRLDDFIIIQRKTLGGLQVLSSGFSPSDLLIVGDKYQAMKEGWAS